MSKIFNKMEKKIRKKKKRKVVIIKLWLLTYNWGDTSTN